MAAHNDQFDPIAAGMLLGVANALVIAIGLSIIIPERDVGPVPEAILMDGEDVVEVRVAHEAHDERSPAQRRRASGCSCRGSIVRRR